MSDTPIGSKQWLEKAERNWHDSGRWRFDAVKAFRSGTLYELCTLRPRPWSGEPPHVLHDHESPSALHPRFVAYLDARVEIRNWREAYRFAQHQPLEWWNERLSELDN